MAQLEKNVNNKSFILLLIVVSFIEIHAKSSSEMDQRLILLITAGGVIGAIIVAMALRHICYDLKNHRKNHLNKINADQNISNDLESGSGKDKEEEEVFDYSSNTLKNHLSPTALKLQETRTPTKTSTDTNDQPVHVQSLLNKFKQSVEVVGMTSRMTKVMIPQANSPIITNNIDSISRDVDTNELFNDYIRSHDDDANNDHHVEIEVVSVKSDTDSEEGIGNIDGHGTQQSGKVPHHGIIIDDDNDDDVDVDENNKKKKNEKSSKYSNYKSKMVTTKSEETLKSIEEDHNVLVDAIEQHVDDNEIIPNITPTTPTPTTPTPTTSNGVLALIYSNHTNYDSVTPTQDGFFNDWFARHHDSDIGDISSQRTSRFNHALENHNFLGEEGETSTNGPSPTTFLVKKNKKKVKVSPQKVKISPKKLMTNKIYSNDGGNDDDDDGAFVDVDEADIVCGDDGLIHLRNS